MRRLALLLYFLTLLSCKEKRDAVEEPAPVSCGEELDCFIAHAHACSPATVVHRQRVLLLGAFVDTAIQYEIFGTVRGRCHIARLQLVPGVPLEAVCIEDEAYTALAQLQPRPLACRDELLHR
jgi:hypothetical protein